MPILNNQKWFFFFKNREQEIKAGRLWWDDTSVCVEDIMKV
jgi:hypothetical protein